MLQNVDFLGHVVKRSSYECFDEPADKGYFELNLDFQEIGQLKHEIVTCIPATIKLVAYAGQDDQDKDESSRLFSCELLVELMFTTADESAANKNALSDNKWYFENYLHVVAKDLLRQQLANTNYKNITVPSVRARD